MSRFAPVHLPEDRKLNGKVSQTFLRHYAACPRSGYLYALHKGEARTAEMMRGSALHAVCERSTLAAMEQGEAVIPPEIVKVIVNEVLADPEFAVPFEEHDYIREMAFRWASETAIDPQAVIAVETLLVWEVGGYQVRAKVDFAELLEGGAVVVVRDYKSSKAAPGFEEISRKRPDETRAAKNFQLVLYALMLAFGVPVRVEECSVCHGFPKFLVPSKDIEVSTADLEDSTIIYGAHQDEVRFIPCEGCDDKGRIEIPEPFPLASRAQRFDLEFVYPGIEDREGKMLRRPVSLTRLELEEYRASLEALLARVAHSEAEGDWPAVQSDAACGECPSKVSCPIPRELKDHRGTINTMAEASEAAEVLDRRSDIDAALRKELKAFAKAHGPIRYGADKVWEFGFMESDRIADKDAFLEAVDRAVRYGEPFERSRFVKVVKSTPFKVRTLSADELAAEAEEGSNGEG